MKKEGEEMKENRVGKAKEGGEGGRGNEAAASGTARRTRLETVNSSKLWPSHSIQFSAFFPSIPEYLFN